MQRGIWKLALSVVLGLPAVGWSDEGMWVFNNLPRQQLLERHGFAPSPEWLEHVMQSAVRFNSGGSGSFVSSDGLVLTNHHVGAETLQKLSTAGHDYYREGFLARTLAEELKAPDLELNVLQSIEDVTERVNGAVPAGATATAAFAARRGIIATIEKESLEKTGLRSDVVTLYQGGQYHLYRYKRYTDIRLVWAPEFAIAFFGGDPDNFEYPRYDLDACIFRAYENDKPAEVRHFLKWSSTGAKEGELVFVAGHPGRTDRLNTLAALKFNRDVRAPFVMDLLRRMEIMLQQYSLRGEEQARIAKEDLFGVQNSRKAYVGQLAGLQDSGLLARKVAAEKAIRDKVAANPQWNEKYGTAWQKIEQAKVAHRALLLENALLEQGRGMDCQLFGIARTLLRLAAESGKPNAERLPEYGDASRASLELQLFSEAPIHEDLEQVKLTHSLGFLAEKLGGDHPLVESVLQGRGPAARAAELLAGTKLKDVAERKRLAAGGQTAIDASSDSLLALAKLVDAPARAIRKRMETEVVEVERQAYAQIAQALFAIEGPSRYPDATFTLRLSFGKVVGYEENGQTIAPFTTVGGAFEHANRHGNQAPWELPQSWLVKRPKLKLETPLNFVATCDIIGGNSGSPVINQAGEVVGLIFDGNIHSLVGDFLYDETRNRAVSVHSSAILESLRTVYAAGELADRLGK